MERPRPLSSTAAGDEPTLGLVRLLSERLLPVGLDLIQPVSVRAYNDIVEPLYRLPDLQRDDPLALIIGNTRALWPPFVDELRQQSRALSQEHPLDAYVVKHLDEAVRALPARAEVRYSHELPPRRVAMQALAEVAGLAWRSPAFLSVHPCYGPWIGLRAAVVLDIDAPRIPAEPAARPCDSCDTQCAPALARASSREQARMDDWRRWLAVRDSCPVGRAHRYDEDQIRYHYTKDRSVLAKVIDAGAPRLR